MARVIKLTDSMAIPAPAPAPRDRTGPPAWLRTGWFLARVGLVIAASVLAWLELQKAYAFGEGLLLAWYARGLERLTVTQYVPVVKEPDDLTLKEIIAQAARKEGLDPLLLEVVAAKESTGGRHLYRFEPDLYQRLLPRYKKQFSDDEVRMLASSHGVFHVLGSTALAECGTHWSRLYDARTSARCAAAYLKKMWDRTAGEPEPGRRLWLTFRGYNGTGASAERYADAALEMLTGRLYRGVVLR